MSAHALAYARLRTEEGKRPRAYNDATGKTVTCQPGGNLSIAYGCNLETGLDDDEMNFLLDHRLTLVETALQAFAWYTGLDDARASVFLDLGYNDGVPTLLHFVHTIAAAAAKDWQTAHDQLLDSAAARELPDRYQVLAQIILTGVA